MTFLIQKNGVNHGLFIHIPKCAGNSAQKIFIDQGYTMIRPSNKYLGHYKLDYSLMTSRKYFGIDEMKSWKIYIQLREPIEWAISSYKYYTIVSPSIHGHKWEHENLEMKGFHWYIETMLSHVGKGVPIPKDCIDRNHKSHAWHKLDSFFSLCNQDLDGLEDLEVIFTTNKSMDKLANMLSQDDENYCIPMKNVTPINNSDTLSLFDDIKVYEMYKKALYNAHFSDHLGIMHELFKDGMYISKLRNLVPRL